ncbi:MAG: bifunctional folylpolyglutamate synthase/dihydrofolate synthase [Planctomycetes bacterium]|nr:bifunctional folylpolyglutamate synthase/dihydrofolate synthase [Planctomycetota bacterium]
MSVLSTNQEYEAALAVLLRRVDFERAAAVGYNEREFKLDRMHELLAHLGHPERQLPVVHITGTKGKGSTAAMVASILTAAGYRTGLFSSPHLHRIEERFSIDGQNCPQAEFIALVERLQPVVERMDTEAAAHGPGEMGPTYFELTTALAWLHFVAHRADVAVMEVGMGGRLDSTNVCLPVVSVITNVSLDHTKQLGATVEAIAEEKAGIVKPGVPVVSGVGPRALAAVEAATRRCGSRWVQAGREFRVTYHPPRDASKSHGMGTIDVDYLAPGREHRWAAVELHLLGRHQAENAALALAVVQELRRQDWQISDTALRHGLATVNWPARVEVLRRHPAVVIDAAHNVAAVEALVATLEESLPARRRVLLLAATKDKDVVGMLQVLLPRFDRVIVTRYQTNPRGVPVEELATLAQQLSDKPIETADDPATAWELANEGLGKDDLLCVTGSFFIAAEIRQLATSGDAKD